MLLQDFDRLHHLVSTSKNDASGADGRDVSLSNDESMMVIGKMNKSWARVKYGISITACAIISAKS